MDQPQPPQSEQNPNNNIYPSSQDSNSRQQNSQMNKPKSKWWLILIITLVVVAGMFFLGFGLFIPIVLLVVGIFLFVSLRKNQQASEKSKLGTSIVGIVLLLISLVLFALQNYGHYVKPEGLGGDVVEPLIYLFALAFSGIIYLAGIFLTFAYKDAPKNYRILRIVMILATLALIVSSFYYFSNKGEQARQKAEQEKNAILSQGISRDEAISLAQKQLQPGVSFKFNAALKEVLGGKAIWSISFLINNKKGDFVMNDVIELDAVSGEVRNSPLYNDTKLTFNSGGKPIDDLEVYSVTLQKKPNANYYYIWSVIDYGITRQGGQVNLDIMPKNELNYIVAAIGNNIKAYQVKEGISNINLDQPTDVVVQELKFQP